MSEGPLALQHIMASPALIIAFTFIKKLDEDLRYQLLGQKLLISPGLYVYLVGKN